MYFNIPTWFTLLRIILIPFLFLLFYIPFNWGPLACSAIFLISSITDWFDGFLARRWKQITGFGAFLDPVADKITVIMALILVAEHFHIWWITLPTASIIFREIIVSALRAWLFKINKFSFINITWIAKIKTSTQMLSLVALLWRSHEWMIFLGITTLYIAVILTFWSMFQYLYAVRCDLFKIY